MAQTVFAHTLTCGVDTPSVKNNTQDVYSLPVLHHLFALTLGSSKTKQSSQSICDAESMAPVGMGPALVLLIAAAFALCLGVSVNGADSGELGDLDDDQLAAQAAHIEAQMRSLQTEQTEATGERPRQCL
jgi:hypothetical protein